jgi:pilus assembly protein Flp/PilA
VASDTGRRPKRNNKTRQAVAGESGNHVKRSVVLCWEHIMNALIRFYREEEGVTAIEYGLIAALIAVAIITVVTTLGTTLAGEFQKIVDALP